MKTIIIFLLSIFVFTAYGNTTGSPALAKYKCTEQATGDYNGDARLFRASSQSEAVTMAKSACSKTWGKKPAECQMQNPSCNLCSSSVRCAGFDNGPMYNDDE